MNLRILLFVGIPIVIIIGLGIAVGLFFLIRYFIRYNAQQKGAKTSQQDEMNKMNIEDL